MPTNQDAKASVSADPWIEAMLDGDFEAAWRVTDGIEACRGKQPGPWHLIWDGTPVDGRNVLVRCEHGLGDTLQFLRYLPLLRQRAKSVVVDLQPQLRTLLPEEPPAEDPGPDRVEIECMEMAYLFRTTVDTIPRQVPYLDAGRIAQAYAGRRFVEPGPLVHIGLAWAAGEWNSSRSLRLADLSPLSAIPGARLYSLQHGPGESETDQAAFPITSLVSRTRDLCAAAAAMLQMDLILSVDTITAHLAGALGIPVWTLLQHRADWRWMRDREDSPWYPSMRLFRQRRPGDWEEVVERVRRSLGNGAGPGGPCETET